jgi:hypothetical protein
MIAPWFIPAGLLVGTLGHRTALEMRRARDGQWRWEPLYLALLAWTPLLIWLMACCVGQYE